MPGAGLSNGCNGKALSEMPAFQPYWGKPAVRNDRGDGGNVGIIRRPLRATVLPDCGGRSEMVVPTATVVPDFRETGKVIAPKSISAITSFTRPCQFEMLN